MTEVAICHPKVVVIGAGSLFFGRSAIWQMVHSPYLNSGTLALVDTDAGRLAKMYQLAKMVIAENKVPLAVEASTERREVLADADFVVLSFADRSARFRGIDCTISAKYGIRMCSGDTIGPGGIFRAMREFPIILTCARDIEALCPDAWVINYINPTAVHGLGLRRYAPRLKSFALCDSLHLPHVKRRYAIRAGIIQQEGDYTEEVAGRFDFRIAGVNHFTWLLKAEYEGKDMTPRIADWLRRDAAETDGDMGSKEAWNSAIAYELYKAYGYIPMVVGHTKEYVRFWQGLGRTPEPIPPLTLWDPEARYRRHDEMWSQVDSFISGRIPIADYMKTFGPDPATDIVENMVGRLGKPFYINTFNDGAISNMAADAFLELCCSIGPDGPRPMPVGEMPRGIRGLQEQVLDTHELTARAVATGDHALLRRAMLTDPLVSSLADADAVIRELLLAEQDALPSCWFD